MRNFICILLLCSGALFAESHQVYVGLIHLAGLVPEVLPSPGTSLQIESPDQALKDKELTPIGFIPVYFREAITQMRERGVKVVFTVEHCYENPLPGKYISVEVWAFASDSKDIVPLIYTLPSDSAVDQVAWSE